MAETIDIIYDGLSEDVIKKVIELQIEKIESFGKTIIAQEPIEKIIVKQIGIRFTIEDRRII